MTWYVNNVYARWSQSLEDALSREFPGSVYRVTNLNSHRWWKPEIIHGLPEGGLLVVRPISDGDTEKHLHSWYQEDVVSWEGFEDFDDRGSELRIPPRVLSSDDSEERALPTEKFLRFLRHIGVKHGTPIIYYQGFWWGGDVEEEFAFVYSGKDESLYSILLVDGMEPRMEVRHNSMTASTTSDRVLVRAMQHVDLNLPTPYFALHTRPFEREWKKYRVAPKGILSRIANGISKGLALLLAALFFFSAVSVAQEKIEKPGPLEKACVEAVKKWEQKSGLQFNIPFPAEKLDTDYWNTQPIASVPVKDQKVHCTRPTAHSGGEYCFISFLLCPGDLNSIGSRNMECAIDMDEKGEFVSIAALVSPDEWTKEKSTTQIQREDGESSSKYLERVVTTYRERAKKAADPAEADRYLAALEKILRGIMANYVAPAK